MDLISEPPQTCPGCGADADATWLLCPYCGEALSESASPTASQGSGSGTASYGQINWGELIVVGFGAALVLAISSLLVPYGSSSGGKSLASLPVDVAYNIPLLLVIAMATALAAFGRTDEARASSIALALLAGLWWVAALIPDAVSTMTHHATLGSGAKLSVIGALLVVASVLLAVWNYGLSLRVTTVAIIWAAASFALAAGWVVGNWMNWTRTTYLASASNFTFRSSGTNVVSAACCVAFRNSTMPENLGQAVILTLIIVAAVAVAFLVPNRAAGIALMGLGVLYFADPLSALYPIIDGHPSAHSLGIPLTEVRNGQITATVAGLPGLWIATGAALILIALGVFRILSSFAEPDSDGNGPLA